MIECPSCRARVAPALICSSCANPLGAETDCFAALGLERHLALDTHSLETIYHELSKKVHPDRFASSPAPVRSAAMRSTAMLTRAYRTLRDPVERGLYWLELRGDRLSRDNNAVPAELAALVFEVQDELEELRSSHGSSTSIEARRAEVEAKLKDATVALVANFSAWDLASENEFPALSRDLKSILSRIAYLRTLVRDIDRTLETARAAHHA